MRHFTLAILAAAAAIAFASCEKPPVEPENPTPVGPIDDPTTAGGITDQLVEFLTNEQGDTTAFQISYTSWMEVDGEKVSVPLKVYYRVLDTTFNVPMSSDFEYDEGTREFKSYGEQLRNGVSVTDSAICRVFSCDYYSVTLECRYEAAVYKDQKMPHLRVNYINMVHRCIDNGEWENTWYSLVLDFKCAVRVVGEEYRIPSRITETIPR